MTYTDGQLTDIVNNKSLTATTRIKALRKLMGAADEEGRVDFWEDKIATENVRRKITSLPDPFVWEGDFETADIYTHTLPKDIYVSGALEINHVMGADSIYNITAREIVLEECSEKRKIYGHIKADRLVLIASSVRALKSLLSECTLDIKDKVVVKCWGAYFKHSKQEEIKTFLHQKGIPKEKVGQYD